MDLKTHHVQLSRAKLSHAKECHAAGVVSLDTKCFLDRQDSETVAKPKSNIKLDSDSKKQSMYKFTQLEPVLADKEDTYVPDNLAPSNPLNPELEHENTVLVVACGWNGYEALKDADIFAIDARTGELTFLSNDINTLEAKRNRPAYCIL